MSYSGGSDLFTERSELKTKIINAIRDFHDVSALPKFKKSFHIWMESWDSINELIDDFFIDNNIDEDIQNADLEAEVQFRIDASCDFCNLAEGRFVEKLCTERYHIGSDTKNNILAPFQTKPSDSDERVKGEFSSLSITEFNSPAIGVVLNQAPMLLAQKLIVSTKTRDLLVPIKMGFFLNPPHLRLTISDEINTTTTNEQSYLPYSKVFDEGLIEHEIDQKPIDENIPASEFTQKDTFAIPAPKLSVNTEQNLTLVLSPTHSMLSKADTTVSLPKCQTVSVPLKNTSVISTTTTTKSSQSKSNPDIVIDTELASMQKSKRRAHYSENSAPETRNINGKTKPRKMENFHIKRDLIVKPQRSLRIKDGTGEISNYFQTIGRYWL